MYPALSAGAIGVRLPFEECARLAADAGFKGIGVNVGAAPADEVRRILEVNKLQPAAWGLPVEFRKDDETFRSGLGQLAELAKAAKQIGALRCSTWIMPFSEELAFEENFELHRSRLRACAEILADSGIRLGLEFVGPKTLREGRRHEFISTQEGMLELCEAIGTGHVGLLFDAFHWYTSHGTKEDIDGLSDALVVDVHVNDGTAGRGPDEQIDNERALPGETGVIDLKTFLGGLKVIGYTGPVTPEPFSRKLAELAPEEAIRATAEALLAVWREAGV